MKALVIDFNNYKGHQMMISSKETFARRELHELELHMLAENSISTLLPLNWLEVDGSISFSYHIEGYRMLTHYLRTQQLTMQRYYSLLLSLADALATCYEYMLRPECCLIDEHVLYIDEQQERIVLAYLPLHEPVYEQQAQQLLLLAVRWSGLVDDLDAKSYHRILQLLSAEKLPIAPLRQLLLDLIHEQAKSTARRSYEHTGASQQTGSKSNSMISSMMESLPASIKEYKAFDGNEADRTQEKNKDKLQQVSGNEANSVNDLAPDLLDLNRWQELEDDDDLYEEETNEHRLLWKHYALVVVVLLAIGFSWVKLYVPQQTVEQLLLCCGITTGMLALLGYMLLKPIQALFASGKLEEPIAFDLVTEHAANASARLAQAIHAGSPPKAAKSGIGDALVSLPEAGILDKTAAGQQDNIQQDNIRDGRNKPQQKPNQLATVKLDEQQATSLLQQAEPMLVRSMNGIEERISIVEASFLIGRADEGVHYREAAKGVSRIHLELELSNGHLQVKDVGSRNGTYLNGQLMIAYKTYRLQKGDRLQLASREGPVYELVS